MRYCSSSASQPPSTAVLSSPFVYSTTPSVELPRLRIPNEMARQQQGKRCSVRAVRYYASVSPLSAKRDATQVPLKPTSRSPSSPSSFFTQEELAKLGLTTLLEAAEKARPSVAEISQPFSGRSSRLKRELSQPLPSIMHVMGDLPFVTDAKPKRACTGFDSSLDVEASYSLQDQMPRDAMTLSSGPEKKPYEESSFQVNEEHATLRVPFTKVQSYISSDSKSSGAHRLSANPGGSVWNIVLTTGKFPADICLGENGSGGRTSETTSLDSFVLRSSSVVDTSLGYEERPARMSIDEKSTAAQKYVAQGGKVLLTIHQNVVADSLQYKTIGSSKKYPSSGSHSHSPLGQDDEFVSPRDESFNPLSLKSIMNDESNALQTPGGRDAAKFIADSNLSVQGTNCTSPRKSVHRVLKRSDYSQHGLVRSGRWSVEEENYAKAMIEAFKSGYLPLHGNVSLRKFLSEVLVCHPMRISKKFVGYVRKYHWYRVAAGKCDPAAKRKLLFQLIQLERAFWSSVQQNNEWSSCTDRHD